MIMAMIRPETEMKDSGIEWIGDIPANWRKSKLKYLGVYINGYAFKPSDWSARGRQIIRIQDLTGSNSGEPNYFNGTLDEKYRVVNGDILVSWAATLDAFIWTKEDGWLNQHIFKAVPNEKIVKGYFLWLLKIAMDNMNNDDKHGIVMQHVTIGLFNNYVVPLAPYTEQQAIADYLDETCSKIDEIIAEAKASIDEYKKLRQGIIFEAVTKGLDKNVEMKSTSVGWIGTVPSHWRVAKIRQVAEFYNGDRSSKYPSGNDIVSEGIIFITSNNLGYIVLNTNISTNKFITKQKYDDLGGAKLRINDIVFCLRGSVGKCAINKTFDEGTIASSLVVIRAKKVDADYLNYVLQNHRITDEAIVNAIGIGSLNLAAHDISEFYMPIPPEREMQDIVRYLDDKVGNVDDLISEKESLINDLEAYKKSLIYEVVTGKRKVV